MGPLFHVNYPQAVRSFSKGEFVVEYAGDLISIDDAKVTRCHFLVFLIPAVS